MTVYEKPRHLAARRSSSGRKGWSGGLAGNQGLAGNRGGGLWMKHQAFRAQRASKVESFGTAKGTTAAYGNVVFGSYGLGKTTAIGAMKALLVIDSFDSLSSRSDSKSVLDAVVRGSSFHGIGLTASHPEADRDAALLASTPPSASGMVEIPAAMFATLIAERDALATQLLGDTKRPDSTVRGGRVVDRATIYEAAVALRDAALTATSAPQGRAATLLRRAAEVEADRRPRHAAVALAGWDALVCNAEPFATDAKRSALWRLAQLLLQQFISTDEEMALLDELDSAGLERVPPFEETVLGDLFGDLVHDEDLR